MSDLEEISVEVEQPQEVDQNELRERRQNRKILKGRITRAINRVRDSIEKKNMSATRMKKEMKEIKSDFDSARTTNQSLYSLVSTAEAERLDHWDDELVTTLYDFEEEAEEFIKYLDEGTKTAKYTTTKVDPVSPPSNIEEQINTHNAISVDRTSAVMNADRETLHDITPNVRDTCISFDHASDISSQSQSSSQVTVDEWIDQLVEFEETVLSTDIRDISVAEALYKLEATRDIPAVTIPKFNGDALVYVDFIERFKLNIHDKPHLKDNMRMTQLKMHLEGEASRLLMGMGNQGVMYATALKTLKQEFGQKSTIARASINKLTKGLKIAPNDRNKLRDLSLDIVSCIATLKQIKYEADINAIENLRIIVKRLPDHLIDKWKTCSADIREKGATPNIESINKFIRRHVKAMFDPDFGDIHKSNQHQSSIPSRPSRAINSTQKIFTCPFCNESHKLEMCTKFKNLSHEKKIEEIRHHRLCFSCLGKGHITRDCRRKKPCGKDGCTRVHNILLHTNPPVASSVSSLDRGSILPILRAKFRSPNGRYIQGNILIDSAAGTTIIRRAFSRELGLQGTRERLDLAVVGGKQVQQRDSRRVKFHISSLNEAEEFEIEAHELDSTVISVPNLDRDWLKSFPHLSDIDFSHVGGSIDLILGVQYSHIHVEEEVRQGLHYEPVARKTKLGWYVIGPDNTTREAPLYSVNFVEKIDLQKFYEFETIGIQAPNCSCPVTVLSLEDKLTMKVFEETCEREGDRYSIGLPWKRNPQLLPNNYLIAERRLISLERSLKRNPAKADLYNDVINDYMKNNWAVEVLKTEETSPEQPVYYLPHHGIYRPEKLSTPLRVVFDPATMVNGTSLNSFLCRGPCLIGSLFGVLIRFRENIVAYTGDISKMFLQILLKERDTHVHRYLWRDLDQSKEPRIYRLLRVAFGDKSSPAMVSFVMLKMAEENKQAFPDASKILERNRYMDDLIHSCNTPERAMECILQLETVLKSGSFRVKQWYCSDSTVRQKLGRADVNVDPLSLEFNLDGENDTKTLGIGWNSVTDVIKFSVKDIIVEKLTKRTILSKVAMFYDPLGLASGVTIKARIALQDIWRSSLDWDDPLPVELHKTWHELFADLVRLREIEYPRCVKPSNAYGEPELHVFGDASSKAYGGIAYLRWNTTRGPESRLISAKARVAPLHQSTIPRLELMAALISSRLAKTIYEEMDNKPSRVILWADSQVVLHWLRSESAILKPFVGLRVAEIQSTWGTDKFRYLPSELNPADDLSRGIGVDQLKGRWMNGPRFLQYPESEWPDNNQENLESDSEFKVHKIVCHVIEIDEVIDISRFSSWPKLVRVLAYCFRFINRTRNKKANYDEVLQPEEIAYSEHQLMILTQRSMVDWEERYRDLAPFIKDGVIRVGGRLRKSPLQYDEIHPVLLMPESDITKLIVRDFHIKNGHCGSERTLGDIRRKYWIVRGRNCVKGLIRQCVICRRLRQPAHTTLMADLPADRLKPFTPPFTATGVDLFGPFQLRISRNKTEKAWGVIFTCATVRAVYLDIVENLSTQAFLQALRRFVATHGWPQVIISDNGSNFVGAEKELRKLYEDGRRELEDFTMLHKTKWKFNTPLSPHQGGFFKALVKQTKKALKVVIGDQILSWNEMTTVFAEVKCLLNSRPISYSSSDPNDLAALTPNHFILGRATIDVPQGPFQKTKNLHKRLEFVQMLVGRFFSRFVKEYFPSLMRRSKWLRKEKQLQVGDIVLLTDPNIPRG